mmetsp:Transcript_12940/g.14873  ORF Transcript_12940/g.14873 Transcript_12940/m.14873 type:complete len:279 (-) Transcript_12940:81-917(-)
MNEQANTYYPLLDINISEVHFEKYIKSVSSKGQTSTYISCFYYNALIGEWEPFIENFKLFINIQAFDNKSAMRIGTDRSLNINLSDVIIQNLIDIFKVWNMLSENAEDKGSELFDHIDQYQKKEIPKFSVDTVLIRNSNYVFKPKRNAYVDEPADELASPISITNLTGIPHVSKQINENEEDENEFTLYYGGIKEPSKVYLPIRVEFIGNFTPIDRIELSKLHCSSHEITDNDTIYYGVHLNQMHKVLTLRTLYTIHNKTVFNYVIRLYDKDTTTMFI